MRTACVTGATGCVGRNLVDELLKDGWDVTVLHRKSSDLSRLAGCAVRFQEVDLYDPESTKQAIPQGVDCVFHVAGNTSHWKAEAERQWKDNVLATRNLVAAALEKKAGRFVFTSTGATLGFQNLDVEYVNRIPNNYIRTKRLAEVEVYRGVERGLDAVVLHPIIVMGAYDWNSYAQIFRRLQSSQLRVCFPGSIVFCHAADVARALVRAYENGQRGEHYVLDGPHATWREAFGTICRRLGVGEPVVIPKPLLMLVARFMALGSFLTKRKPLLTPELIRLLDDAPDVTEHEKWKTRRDLGYTSRPLDAMVEDCYRWLVKEGRLPAPAREASPPRLSSRRLLPEA